MPIAPVILLFLGFPISVAANITTHVFINLLRRLNQRSMEKMFFDTFIETLKTKKELDWFLKKTAKTNRKNIIGIFTAGIKIQDMSNVSKVFKYIETPEYRKQVAKEMVKVFSIEPKFQTTIQVIIKYCLENYKQVFLNSLTTEEGVRLLVAQQFRNDENLLEKLKGIVVELNKKIEKTATKEDLNKGFEDLKKFIKTSKDQIQKPPVLEEKKPKQIKILSMMASPEAEKRDYYIHYEKEQDTMVEVFKHFDREKVFIDMPDPVKSTLVEIEEHLQDGHHDILHITAHGGIYEKGQGYLCLEDTWGKLQKVTGSQLANTLKQCPTPKIVILSVCHSAGDKPNPDFIPVARALFKAKIDLHTVIGMKKAISHDAAIDFNKDFFKTLCEGNTVKKAFKKGKAAILKGELQRRENNPELPFLDECEIPALLTRKQELNAEKFSHYRIQAPARPQSHQFMGAKYLERGFIGRREILRKIYRAVEKNEGAVVLKGPGGIGKSTITTRSAANLHRKGYDFIVIHGETSIEKILEAISLKAVEKEV
jgi:hypothetical protein